MRDPAASIKFEATRVVRSLHAPLKKDDFLYSNFAEKLVQNRHLVPFEIESDVQVSSSKIPFVSYPFEWCDAQFYSAATLTLKIQKEAVAAGFDLKDASAWNVIFSGSHPQFCDLMSFSLLDRKKWWAMGQFSRHFIVPLLISRLRGVRANQSLSVWRDGVPSDVARNMLGARRFLTRYWPLISDGQKKDEAEAGSSKTLLRVGTPEHADCLKFRSNLHISLDWMTSGVQPNGFNSVDTNSPWVDYTSQRQHYPAESLSIKKNQISAWLQLVKPAWVADLGCNTGEFTQMALDAGASVIAIDSDHASIEKMYLQNRGNTRVYPVLAPLDDVSGGRGWMGVEFPGLVHRLKERCDLVMMLALIHHLAIAASIPFKAIAQFVASCTSDWVIVEWLQPEDPQVVLLCQFHDRLPSEFGLTAQRNAFIDAGFVIESEISLQPAARTLALLRKAK